jgi:phosphomannomutase / phosphoglucomutase
MRNIMHDSIFREYDIRGKVGSEFIIEDVYKLAQAIATYFLQLNPNTKTVAIGMDGRLTSPAINERVIAALSDSGLNTIFIGVCPSPVLYFALYTLPVDAGLMITASHNPQEYNGIKILLGKKSVWGKQIQEIRRIYKGSIESARPEQVEGNEHSKGVSSEQPLIPAYIDWLYAHFPLLHGMLLPVVIDCGNGAAGTVLPELIKKMRWSAVQLLCCEVDGTYPNHEADPVVYKNMLDVRQALATTAAVVGIGLDGDCDRMAAMTKDGFLVPGDQLLAVFAQQVVAKHPHAAIVFDIKSSQGLIELLQQWGAKPCISPAGHAIIKDTMERNHALLGGELSCHFFFHDRYFGYDDGIYALMRLLEILVTTGKSLPALITIFPKRYSTPEIRIACAEEQKHNIINDLKQHFSQRADAQIITIDGVRVTLPYGWAIVRASNTQPVLSMRFESETEQGLARIKQDFIDLLSRYFDMKTLQAL